MHFAGSVTLRITSMGQPSLGHRGRVCSRQTMNRRISGAGSQTTDRPQPLDNSETAPAEEQATLAMCGLGAKRKTPIKISNAIPNPNPKLPLINFIVLPSMLKLPYGFRKRRQS